MIMKEKEETGWSAPVWQKHVIGHTLFTKPSDSYTAIYGAA